MRLPKKFSQKSRKVFYFIHLWTGLLIGLWFVMMGLTGSLLSWKSEIGEWEMRRRVSAPLPGPNDKIIPASKAIAALKASDPDLTPERNLHLPNEHGGYYFHTARTRVSELERITKIYLVNPVTAQVYPPIDESTLWIDITERFHWSLLLGVKGTVTNGFFTFFTVFMLTSGAWLWWPSNFKQFKQRISWKKGVSLRRTLYDLHNMMGVYLFGLLFLLAFTGLVICYNGQTDQSIRKGINRLAGVKDEPRGGRGGGGEERGGGNRAQGGRGAGATGRGAGASGRGAGERSGEVSGRGRAAGSPAFTERSDRQASGETLSIDAMVEKAQAAFPSNTLLSIRMPRRPSQPFQASYDRFGIIESSVSFDSTTGKQLASDGRPPNPGNNTMNAMFQLHYGWFGGNWSKILYCISGFLPLGLFITGFWMWWKKKKYQIDRNRAAKLKPPIVKTNSNNKATPENTTTSEDTKVKEPVAV